MISQTFKVSFAINGVNGKGAHRVVPRENLPGTVEVPMATGRPNAAFVLDRVRRSDLHKGEQLDRPLQKGTRKPESRVCVKPIAGPSGGPSQSKHMAKA